MFAHGQGFLEGPRWHAGRLFAASPRGRRIVAFDADGTAEVLYETSGFPLGLGWDEAGRILVVSMDDRLLRFSQRLSADHFVLELHEHEH